MEKNKCRSAKRLLLSKYWNRIRLANCS
ncbi:hypothetical protein DSM3645_03168 [Blastopirellula marina DSM 3645]|uniref:Uncharacterized protein n=1 Tax=Blastopirellula marina DSM 3645 TaxID=314230 RepID=A3ZVU7_9BACT|nr:hypothetical protein DSM3645_03168 [Blastopirellula marina DSM 3645]